MNLYKLKMLLKKNKIIYFPFKKYRDYKMNKILTKRRTILQKNGFKIINELEKTLQPTKIKYFMAYGSLLGMIRESQFIKFDDDIDYGIILDEKFDWNKLENALTKAGFKKVKEFIYENDIAEQTYEKYGLPIDFFLFYEENKKVLSKSFIKEKDRYYKNENEFTLAINYFSYFDNVKILEINGLRFSAPMNPELFLENAYTINWNKPNSSWNDYLNPNYKVFSDCLAIGRYIA